MTPKSDKARQPIERLSRSQIYRDYEEAFSRATGLPLSIRSVESFEIPHRGKKQANPFCVLMANQSRTCAACLEVQDERRRSQVAKRAL